MRIIILSLLFFLLPTSNTLSLPPLPDIIGNLTISEKINFLHGQGQFGSSYTGKIDGIPRLGIPTIYYNDGPQGFRSDTLPGTSTPFPSGLTVAATFDRDAARSWGEALGQEFYRKGAQVLLGPGMCVARVPLNGRNFEYLSGEDPFLGQELVRGAIEGIQSNKILANAKHFAMNQQETNRRKMSSNVDSRTRFEYYYPPFQSAIDAGVGSIMCSYNKINNVAACGNNETLQLDLRDAMKYENFVMSDWFATHDAAIDQGLDQEMPGSFYMNERNLAHADVELLDRSVERFLKPFYDLGVFEAMSEENKYSNNVTTEEHVQVAREISEKSHVLLKNEGGVLPFGEEEFKSYKVGVFGSQASEKGNIIGGSGSGSVIPGYKPYPLGVIEDAVLGGGGSVQYSPISSELDLRKASKIAPLVDVCLFYLAATSGEGSDRADLSLTGDLHVSSIARLCPVSAAVITAPGPFLLPWADDVDAVVVNFMPGVAGAYATVDVLTGKADPGGRLPATIPYVENETEMSTGQYPGSEDGTQAEYSEKGMFGYRWYLSSGVRPRYHFGHGLSYGDFVFGGGGPRGGGGRGAGGGGREGRR